MQETRGSEPDSRGGRFEALEQQAARTVRDRRVALGLSQADLAGRMTAAGLPMHQTTIGKLEAGQRPIRLAELFALGECLRTPWVALLGVADLPARGSETVAGLDEWVEAFRQSVSDTEGRISAALRQLAESGSDSLVAAMVYASRIGARGREGDGDA